MASRLSPYLQFRDTARQALEFYHGVLGGDLTLSTFGDMGVEGQEAHKIMHGMLTTTDEFVLMGSDTPEQMEYTPGGNFSISLTGDDADDLRRWFDALADGGTITMPLEKQV